MPDDSQEPNKNDEEKKDGGEKKEDAKEQKPKQPFKWTPLKVTALVVVGIVVLIVGIIWYIYASHHESTDDAYTTGYVHTISSRVAGTVIEVAVDDNEHVRHGQVLVRLDPRDYQVQVDKAQADYDRAKADFDRVDALKNDVAISKQDYDQTKTQQCAWPRPRWRTPKNQLSYCTIVGADGRLHRQQDGQTWATAWRSAARSWPWCRTSGSWRISRRRRSAR